MAKLINENTPELVKLVPVDVARRHNIFPVSKLGEVMTIAMSNTANLFAVDDLKLITKCQIQIVAAPQNEIRDAIEKFYGPPTSSFSDMVKTSEKEIEKEAASSTEDVLDTYELKRFGSASPIIKMVDLILLEAMRRRASDIHIEPQRDGLRVRFRIDGSLVDFYNVPKKNQNAVLARIKIMSALDITQARLPQDGRFKIRAEGREIDFRVSILPIRYGGKVVLRLLDKANLSFGLDKLGFPKESLELFKKAIKRNYGMILVTGPTGSGKSTTLYSVLMMLNTPEKNIVTIEDPVEYQIEGITQIQIHHEIDLTFANGLRSILRQAPDIVMVGEIRDTETADIAIKAALTGHLIFSTLHTNDASGALVRLVDMGVEPFMIASSVVMVAAQRLLRRICQDCKEPYEVGDVVLARLGIERKKGVVFYRGKGCDKCNMTGYMGRMGILEALMIDDAVKDMIISRVPSEEIKAYVVKNGMQTLREDALKKCLMGLTTIEEVLRVTSEE